MDQETWVRISHSVYGLLQYRHRHGLILPTVLLLPLCIYSLRTLQYAAWFTHLLIQ